MLFSKNVAKKLQSLLFSFQETIDNLQQLIEESQSQIEEKENKIKELSNEKDFIAATKFQAETFKTNLENLFK